VSLVWLGLMVIFYGVVGPSVTLQLAFVAIREGVRVVGVARPDGHFVWCCRPVSDFTASICGGLGGGTCRWCGSA